MIDGSVVPMKTNDLPVSPRPVPERDNPSIFTLSRASHCSEELRNEIGRFLDAQPFSHPFQHPEWTGRGSYFGIDRFEGRITCFANCGLFYPAGRLFWWIRALTVNHGPVSGTTDATIEGLQKLKDEAFRQGIAYIEITPEWPDDCGGELDRRLKTLGWHEYGARPASLRLSLDRDSDDLLSSFRKVTRYEIRRSLRSEIEVRIAQEPEESNKWIELHREMAVCKGFPADDSAHFHQVLDWLRSQPNRGALLLAFHESSLLGGVVVVRSGERCWYLYGATSKREKYGVGHLLQWKAMQWARMNGCREYDFGGYREDTTTGPAFFKRGFCDNVVKFLPPRRLILNPHLYRAAKMIGTIHSKLRII